MTKVTIKPPRAIGETRYDTLITRLEELEAEALDVKTRSITSQAEAVTALRDLAAVQEESTRLQRRVYKVLRNYLFKLASE
jgi:hypothetical protein